MPTYEYACRSCKRHTEAVQRFTDPPLTECPHCGGELKRVFHPVGIVLKGSGFYSTDNRSAKRTLAGVKDAGEGAPAGESKPGSDSGSDSGSAAAAGSGESKGNATTPDTGSSSRAESKPAKKDTKKPESKK